MPDHRACVICRTPFLPATGKQWTCSDRCADALRVEGEMNQALKEEMGGGEGKIRGVGALDGPPEVVSEADKARAYFKGPAPGIQAMMAEARAERARLGPLVGPQGESTWREYLQAAGKLAECAAGMSGAEDSYVLVGLAQGYLGRAQEHLECRLERDHVGSGEDLRPPDGVPFGGGWGSRGPEAPGDEGVPQAAEGPKGPRIPSN